MLQKITETKQISYVIPYREGKSICIKIGRSEENDIIMSDMSISRRHAYLNIYPGGDVQLSDNKSKLGTFLALKRNIYNC
jgi:pSer/pThr/pTyr-binding forkhead associated (FHA) protein